jgi:hypothetical protein
MKRKDRKNKGKGTCFQFILPGLIILLLLTSMAQAQSALEDEHLDFVHMRADLEKSAAPPNRPQVSEISSSFSTVLVGEFPVSHWWQNYPQSPLPPVSAFTLQTNLCKYLDTCPTPGAVSRDEPSDEELTDDGLM